MTTIAYDGHYIAADGRASQGNLIVGKRTPKLFPLTITRNGVPSDAVLAGAGSYQTLVTVAKHLAESDAESPEMIPDIDQGEFQGLLVIRDSGEVFCLEDRLILTPAEVPTALGSGMDYALTAMALDKNAEEAVHVACELDCFSGGDIAVFDTRTWQFVKDED